MKVTRLILALLLGSFLYTWYQGQYFRNELELQEFRHQVELEEIERRIRARMIQEFFKR